MKLIGETIGAIAGAALLLFWVWVVAVALLTSVGILALFPFVDFGGGPVGGVNLHPVDYVAPYAAWVVSVWMAACAVFALAICVWRAG